MPYKMYISYNNNNNNNNLFPSVMKSWVSVPLCFLVASVTANAVLICTKGGYGLEPYVRLANR